MLSCGEQKVGNIVIIGEKVQIDTISKEVMELLDAKGKPVWTVEHKVEYLLFQEMLKMVGFRQKLII